MPPEAEGAVFTAADLPRIKPIRVVTQAPGAKPPPWPPLAIDKVRFVGEAIAACVAPTRAEAEDLAAAVTVDFEVLDAVVDARRDMRAAATLVHENWGDNLYQRARRSRAATSMRRRAPPRSWCGANTACTASRARRSKAAPCSPIATTGSTRSWSTPRPRRRTRCASRWARSSASKERRIRVVAPDVGGGFGPKARL